MIARLRVKLLRSIFTTLVLIYAVEFAIIAVFPYFGLHILSGSGAFGLIKVTLIPLPAAIVSAFIVSRLELSKLYSEIKPSSDLAGAVITSIDSLMKTKDYQVVLRLSSSLSRPLWLEGALKERIKLGEYMLLASSSVAPEKTEARIQALIDELGWSNFVFGNSLEAVKNIKEGTEEASKCHNEYWYSKGLRHLANISVENGNFPEGEEYFRQAEDAANSVNDIAKKIELLGEIDYGRGLMYFKRKDVIQAEQAFKKAKDEFESVSDEERSSRIFSRLGEIYETGEGYQSLHIAYRYYLQGIEISKRLRRNDELVKNTLGLGKVLEKQGKAIDAAEQFQEALQLADVLGLEKEKKEAKILLKSLSKSSSKVRSNRTVQR